MLFMFLCFSVHAVDTVNPFSDRAFNRRSLSSPSSYGGKLADIRLYGVKQRAAKRIILVNGKKDISRQMRARSLAKKEPPTAADNTGWDNNVFIIVVSTVAAALVCLFIIGLACCFYFRRRRIPNQEKWYFEGPTKTMGPFTRQKMRTHVLKGIVTPKTMVKLHSFDDFVPLKKLFPSGRWFQEDPIIPPVSIMALKRRNSLTSVHSAVSRASRASRAHSMHSRVTSRSLRRARSGRSERSDTDFGAGAPITPSPPRKNTGGQSASASSGARNGMTPRNNSSRTHLPSPSSGMTPRNNRSRSSSPRTHHRRTAGIGIHGGNQSCPGPWCYKTPTGKIHGPFSAETMRAWFTKGMFPLNLQISFREKNGPFLNLGDVFPRNPFGDAPIFPPNYAQHQQREREHHQREQREQQQQQQQERERVQQYAGIPGQQNTAGTVQGGYPQLPPVRATNEYTHQHLPRQCAPPQYAWAPAPAPVPAPALAPPVVYAQPSPTQPTTYHVLEPSYGSQCPHPPAYSSSTSRQQLIPQPSSAYASTTPPSSYNILQQTDPSPVAGAAAAGHDMRGCPSHPHHSSASGMPRLPKEEHDRGEGITPRDGESLPGQRYHDREAERTGEGNEGIEDIDEGRLTEFENDENDENDSENDTNSPTRTPTHTWQKGGVPTATSRRPKHTDRENENVINPHGPPHTSSSNPHNKMHMHNVLPTATRNVHVGELDRTYSSRTPTRREGRQQQQQDERVEAGREASLQHYTQNQQVIPPAGDLRREHIEQNNDDLDNSRSSVAGGSALIQREEYLPTRASPSNQNPSRDARGAAGVHGYSNATQRSNRHDATSGIDARGAPTTQHTLSQQQDPEKKRQEEDYTTRSTSDASLTSDYTTSCPRTRHDHLASHPRPRDDRGPHRQLQSIISHGSLTDTPETHTIKQEHGPTDDTQLASLADFLGSSTRTTTNTSTKGECQPRSSESGGGTSSSRRRRLRNDLPMDGRKRGEKEHGLNSSISSSNLKETFNTSTPRRYATSGSSVRDSTSTGGGGGTAERASKSGMSDYALSFGGGSGNLNRERGAGRKSRQRREERTKDEEGGKSNTRVTPLSVMPPLPPSYA